MNQEQMSHIWYTWDVCDKLLLKSYQLELSTTQNQQEGKMMKPVKEHQIVN